MVVSLLGDISAAHHGCLPTNGCFLRRNWYALVLVSGKRLSLGISLVGRTVRKIYGEDDEADDLEMTAPN